MKSQYFACRSPIWQAALVWAGRFALSLPTPPRFAICQTDSKKAANLFQDLLLSLSAGGRPVFCLEHDEGRGVYAPFLLPPAASAGFALSPINGNLFLCILVCPYVHFHFNLIKCFPIGTPCMVFHCPSNLKSYFLIVVDRSAERAGCPEDELLIPNGLCLFHEGVDQSSANSIPAVFFFYCKEPELPNLGIVGLTEHYTPD